jgi:hypothetical protein
MLLSEPGTRINFVEDARIILQPATCHYISSFRGIFKTETPLCRNISMNAALNRKKKTTNKK